MFKARGAMEQRPFGNTGVWVSQLGLGAGELGDRALPDGQAADTLAAVLDAGMTLLDTARGYGESEARIGRFLGPRRKDVVLSTKVGYQVEGRRDWSYAAVALGIDESLRRLQTDWLDIVHLHSCDLETLRRGEAIRALLDARQAGKLRVAAYSGENEALAWAVASGHFQSFQCSVSLCDQRALATLVPQIEAQGGGLLAKRPVANAPWRFDERPYGTYGEEYWYRWHTMARTGDLDPRGLSWQELAVRFVAHLPGVPGAIIGLTQPAHAAENAAYAARGPLPADHVAAIRAAFQQHDEDWLGLT
ncbi:MAG: aldo/keto reductase [Anaerolineales bacterium]|nr:aldo/keto reductase [Anaerolineales bacterium]